MSFITLTLIAQTHRTQQDIRFTFNSLISKDIIGFQYKFIETDEENLRGRITEK